MLTTFYSIETTDIYPHIVIAIDEEFACCNVATPPASLERAITIESEVIANCAAEIVDVRFIYTQTIAKPK